MHKFQATTSTSDAGLGFSCLFGFPYCGDTVTVAPGGMLYVFLQWNDPFGASANDYDLLVFDSNLRLIADSGNPQTGTQDPIEEVSIVNPAPATQTFKLAIIKAAGATRVLKLFCFGAVRQQYVTPSGSVVGQPALRDAVAVGAIDVSDAALATVEPYSSQGPARIFFPALPAWRRMKWSTSGGMSSRRSRRGGTSMGNTLSR